MNMPNKKSVSTAVAVALACTSTAAYEISNHATMAANALNISTLRTDNTAKGKLFRLGLKQVALSEDKQRFPRSIEGAPEKQCYGYTKLDDGSLRKAEDDVAEPPDLPGSPNAGKVGYTLIDLIRFGVCYEDNNEFPSGSRSLAHFYDPQNGGGLFGNPASPDWALTGTANPSTGVNHFSYNDARAAFYQALTKPTKPERDKSWGLTFQALGHVIHHLEDMAQPQHVRKDDHCDSSLCRIVGAYRPSAYEKYAGDARRIAFIRSLAATATTPILFGLPRDFWSSSPTVSGYQNSAQGIAGYTSTNFVSSGTDFKFDTASGAGPGPVTTTPNYNLPVPTQTPSERITVATALGGLAASPRINQFCPDTTKCFVSFYGSNNMPTARLSSASIFSQDFGDPVGVPLLGPKQGFAQNSFTYNYAATDLVPKAVEYSAGLINYFFRGEMAIRLPAEGLYGIIDGGNPASTCKDSCGFPKLKLRVKNTTAAINGVAQDMVGGTLVGVVKFSRNSCYTSDWLGDYGELNTGFSESTCLLGSNGDPVEEQVVSAPVTAAFSLAANAEQQITLDFSAKPIPVNAWNIKVQLVYQGQLGLEPNAVVVGTHLLSAPAVYRVVNETNYLLVNRRLYARAQVNADQTLLSQITPPTCVTGAAGSRTLAVDCFNVVPFATNWRSPMGQTLATLTALPVNTQAVLLMLGDSGGTINGSAAGLGGGFTNISVYARAVYLDDASNTAFADGLFAYRGLQAINVFYNTHFATVDTTPAPDLEVVNRPALPNPTPLVMTAVNF